MAKYKLVIDNGTLITGAELKELLEEIGFSVPEKFNWIPIPVPPAIPSPRLTFPYTAESLAAYKLERLAWREADDALMLQRAAIVAENNANSALFFNQYNNFASELASIFAIAREVITGTDTKGQKIREYRVLPNPGYSFLQCAWTLIGSTRAAPADPIDFICNNYFGG